ncbi:ribonuclease H-like domain-containing protein [Methanogenium organophilum]|uniref:Ribonuclease H-like domain-containing protein n=1 Tax=Methanogenium organophilum TaxID=2199 RepID=A0A9X9S212_METOG|nr:ribonuclease H-like domain-containing protein [Methanogenium organophilum]WAI00301.1 ribonuclease H-like domain-containing protein [Methanogenium organophilum]
MYDGRLITGVAERWAGETAATYDVASCTPLPEQTGWFPGISSSINPHLMQRSLLAEYEGCTVEDLFGGHEVHTLQGTCYAIESSEEISISRPEITTLADTIMQDLCLIPGIGEITADKLRRKGIRSISELKSHSRFSADAHIISDAVAAEDWAYLESYCCRRRSSSDNLFLLFSLTTPIHELLFFDIETLGLFSRPAILLGTGRIHGKEMIITQYLLRDIGEEPSAISAILGEITETTRLVTYNGRAFDYPFLRDRAGYYGIRAPAEPTHTDLLHHVRRQWKWRLPDCRLGTVEGEILGRYREDDLPGSMVPWYYQTYKRLGNPGPLVPITEHNRIDIANLPRIYERLLEGCLCP